MEKKYVLAMYDVRGKQEYIFRSGKLKEIIGGSCIIRDCFRTYLYTAAKEYRDGRPDVNGPEAIYVYEKNESFSVEDFEFRLSADGGKYIGEMIYDGGGNLYMLYRDRETCIGVNKIFSRKLLEETYTLNVLCTFIELENGFADFRSDQKRIYEKHEKLEAEICTLRPVNTLPIVQVDYKTAMPLTQKVPVPGESGPMKKITTERFCKLKKYEMVLRGNEAAYGNKILDEIVHEKGEDSLLAVIFIDGNSMGAKVAECLKGKSPDYETSINELRRFSARIQKEYVDDRKEAIDTALREKNGVGGKASQRRFVVYAGDEMSFICKARDALDTVRAYFRDLPKEDSACAGIAIFHSHAPYIEAYRIAEECCESGKAFMKKRGEKNTCYIDFHYCQGGLGMSLDVIRERESGGMLSKPWLWRDADKEIGKEAREKIVSMEKVEQVVADLNRLGSRTNVKGLAEAAKSSLAAFDMEMSRIKAHQTEEIQKKIQYTFDDLSGEERRKLVYDIVLVYDLWFREGEKHE
ncbi:MAG TPA: hypothetical protein DF613_17210 [Lachnospiraceae bacterium]|nr:hypothetical protein [Lachnospiraceae bacterium]